MAFTVADHPALRDAVRSDLDRIVAVLRGWAPAAVITLGGSFARGEAVAWWRDGRLVALSDYDVFVQASGGLWPGRLRSLWRVLAPLQHELHSGRVDCNVLLPGTSGWQASVPRIVLAGSVVDGGRPAPGARVGFALHTLHAAQLELLSCAPCRPMAPLERRFRINRGALAVLRAAWNLEADQPAYSLRACSAPLHGPWGQGFEAPVRGLLDTALGENPELGLARSETISAAELAARWMLARRAVEILHERWAWQEALEGPGGWDAGLRERGKGRVRLLLAGLRSGRWPALIPEAHRAIFEVRRAWLEAVLPSGALDPSWLERAQRHTHRLGLGPRRWPTDPLRAYALAVTVTALPNPARIVLSPSS